MVALRIYRHSRRFAVGLLYDYMRHTVLKLNFNVHLFRHLLTFTMCMPFVVTVHQLCSRDFFPDRDETFSFGDRVESRLEKSRDRDISVSIPSRNFL